MALRAEVTSQLMELLFFIILSYSYKSMSMPSSDQIPWVVSRKLASCMVSSSISAGTSLLHESPPTCVNASSLTHLII